jgi:hypothetical protein
MRSGERLQAGLDSAMSRAGSGLAAADVLCRVCVELLEFDGAAFRVLHEGATSGTFGSSGELSWRLEDFQFTFGEGPCLDAAYERPVPVADLAEYSERRWPAFAETVLGEGVRAVFALPVSINAATVGGFDLFCHRPGPLTSDQLGASLHAAGLAALPLLDLMGSAVGWESAGEGGAPPPELTFLERVEVYQATGMVMAQLGVGPEEALIWLWAYAFAHDQTASAVAWSVVERRLSFTDDMWHAGAS